MSKSSETQPLMEALFPPDPLTVALREKIRGLIETMVDAELTEVLAAGRYERAGERRGYRHGQPPRTITTGLGLTQLTLPRGRVQHGQQTREWHSHVLPRDERRAGAVDAALLGSYLSGTNGRRLKGALAPWLRGAPLSKSAVSRVVGRVKTFYETWHRRRLEEESIIILYLDAMVLRVRLAQKVVSVPVLVALGVRADGQKVVLDLDVLTSESTTAWSGLLESLIARGLRRPQLGVIDGNPGLRAALETSWPGLPVPRCTVHKLRNLERHAPRHAHEEIRAAYHRIVYAASGALARQAYRAFVATWEPRAPKVAERVREAGEELLTCYRLPPSQWKSARTTNAMERLHGEFRRRVNTQGALPTAQTAEVLLYALLLTGQIRLRRIDGWQQMAAIPSALVSTAAAYRGILEVRRDDDRLVETNYGGQFLHPTRGEANFYRNRATTTQRYAHHYPESLRDGVEVLDRIKPVSHFITVGLVGREVEGVSG